MSKPKVTKKRLLEAMRGSGGIVSAIAKKLRVDWHTADAAIQRYPEAQQLYKAEKEAILDLGETQTVRAMKKGDMSAVKWYMSKKGKERGYGDDPITINNTVNSTVKSALPNISTEALEQIDAILAGEGIEEDKGDINEHKNT